MKFLSHALCSMSRFFCFSYFLLFVLLQVFLKKKSRAVKENMCDGKFCTKRSGNSYQLNGRAPTSTFAHKIDFFFYSGVATLWLYAILWGIKMYFELLSIFYMISFYDRMIWSYDNDRTYCQSIYIIYITLTAPLISFVQVSTSNFSNVNQNQIFSRARRDGHFMCKD